MRTIKKLTFLLLAVGFMNVTMAQDKTVEVGGAEMYPSFVLSD